MPARQSCRFCAVWLPAPRATLTAPSYTRRGGIDINPYRTSDLAEPPLADVRDRTARQ